MKTGLFFGSFNPIHIGHMAIANYMVAFTDIQQVWFVVSPHNPLKEKKTLLSDTHRLRLVREAIADDTRFKASNIEFKLPQPSYTINTLAYLKEKYPAKQFALIIGADNLQTFHKWKNYQEILKQYELYVYPRHNYSPSPSRLREALWRSKVESPVVKPDHPKVKLTTAPIMEISSTFIREAIRDKKDIRHYLPEAVYKYIVEMHFYEK